MIETINITPLANPITDEQFEQRHISAIACFAGWKAEGFCAARRLGRSASALHTIDLSHIFLMLRRRAIRLRSLLDG